GAGDGGRAVDRGVRQGAADLALRAVVLDGGEGDVARRLERAVAAGRGVRLMNAHFGAAPVVFGEAVGEPLAFVDARALLVVAAAAVHALNAGQVERAAGLGAPLNDDAAGGIAELPADLH